MLKQDIDIVRIVDTIHKLRAFMKIAVGNDDNLISKIKREYKKQKTINTNENGVEQETGFMNENWMFEKTNE